MLECIVSFTVPFLHNHGKGGTVRLVNLLWRSGGDVKQRECSGLTAEVKENITVYFPKDANVWTKIRSFLFSTPTLPQALSFALFSGAVENI